MNVPRTPLNRFDKIIHDRMLQKEQIDHLSEVIEDTYGSPEKLAQNLDLGIEMLFYIEEDTFERREIQDVVSAIRLIINTLRLKQEQKANRIIGIINDQDVYPFDFTDAVARFKERSWDLDDFCLDETLSFHLLNKDTVEDTPQNREIYYLRLRKHIQALRAKGKLK